VKQRTGLSDAGEQLDYAADQDRSKKNIFSFNAADCSHLEYLKMGVDMRALL